MVFGTIIVHYTASDHYTTSDFEKNIKNVHFRVCWRLVSRRRSDRTDIYVKKYGLSNELSFVVSRFVLRRRSSDVMNFEVNFIKSNENSDGVIFKLLRA